MEWSEVIEWWRGQANALLEVNQSMNSGEKQKQLDTAIHELLTSIEKERGTITESVNEDYENRMDDIKKAILQR